MDQEIEKYCWSVDLDHEYKEKLSAFIVPRFKQALEFVGLSLR